MNLFGLSGVKLRSTQEGAFTSILPLIVTAPVKACKKPFIGLSFKKLKLPPIQTLLKDADAGEKKN